VALCQCNIYCSYWPQFVIREIPFYRRWRLLLLILLILWYFRLRHAPSNKLPLHAFTSTLLSHYADQQRRKGCHIDTYDREARHVSWRSWCKNAGLRTSRYFSVAKKDLYKNWRDRLPYIPSGFNENHFVQTTVDRWSDITLRMRILYHPFVYKDLFFKHIFF